MRLWVYRDILGNLFASTNFLKKTGIGSWDMSNRYCTIILLDSNLHKEITYHNSPQIVEFGNDR